MKLQLMLLERVMRKNHHVLAFVIALHAINAVTVKEVSGFVIITLAGVINLSFKYSDLKEVLRARYAMFLYMLVGKEFLSLKGYFALKDHLIQKERISAKELLLIQNVEASPTGYTRADVFKALTMSAHLHPSKSMNDHIKFYGMPPQIEFEEFDRLVKNTPNAKKVLL